MLLQDSKCYLEQQGFILYLPLALPSGVGVRARDFSSAVLSRFF